MDKFKCDGCGEKFDYEAYSEDGYNKFCENCWSELQAERQAMRNAEMEAHL